MSATKHPLWARARAEWSAPLTHDLRVDVAVVGGGITGITAALNLVKAGKRVVLVEAHALCEGESANTTAHLTTAVDARYVTIKKNFGEEAARLVFRASQDAIHQIAALSAWMKIDCAFRVVPGYLYAEKEKDLRDLHLEYETLRALGAPVENTRDVPLPFKTCGAVRFDANARFNPSLYLEGLLHALTDSGCRIYENTPVVEFHDGEPGLLRTPKGRISADSIILATHAPLNRLFVQTKLVHYRSYAMAFLYDGEIGDGLFWDTESPYHYIRKATVDNANYIIVGGEDHKTGQEDHADLAFERLLSYSKERFGVHAAANRWSGQIIESIDGLPFIGRNSACTNVYIATGFAGNGLTFGTVAGNLLSDLVLGRQNPYEEIFSATRVKPVAGATAFMGQAVDYPAHLIGDRLGEGEGGEVSHLPPGEGRVLRVGNESLAVYRDELGALHALSPVCTHLGCHVKFNSAEKSWDCPCHGSRFSIDGVVMNGPALIPLTQKKIG